MSTAPFPLGSTFYGATQTIDTSSSYANVGGIGLEGRECEFPDVDPSNPTVLRSSDKIRTRIVRNTSGVTLYPSVLASYTPASRLKRVNGYARVAGDSNVAGLIDPYLSTTAGVRDGDLFHVIIEGTVTIKTPKAGSDFGATSIAAGDNLFAVTDAAANATTSNLTNRAGRLRTFSAAELTNGTGASLAGNIVATAISAMASNQTNTDQLVHIHVVRG